MIKYLLIRMASALPTLLGMTIVAFAIVSLAPGDPIEQELRAMGIVPTVEDLNALRAKYGLDKPFIYRYLDWMSRAVQFDFGTSIATGRTVINEISLHFPATFTLAISALFGTILISLTLGIAAVASNQNTASFLRALTVVLVSIPSFWLALILIYIFVFYFGWARLVGDGSLRDLVLPVITLSLGSGAALGRVVYERIRAEMCEDYVRLAIAKGVSPAKILLRHITPRIIGPLATAWTNALGGLLGGAVIVESIFGWPGLGQLILQAISQRDFPIIQAYLVFMGLGFFITSLIADIIVIITDPQLRRKNSHE